MQHCIQEEGFNMRKHFIFIPGTKTRCSRHAVLILSWLPASGANRESTMLHCGQDARLVQASSTHGAPLSGQVEALDVAPTAEVVPAERLHVMGHVASRNSGERGLLLTLHHQLST